MIVIIIVTLVPIQYIICVKVRLIFNIVIFQSIRVPFNNNNKNISMYNNIGKSQKG